MDRRTFMKGMAGVLAAGVAPAVLPSGILMPIKPIWTPRHILYGDGIHDDTTAVQALINGERVEKCGVVFAREGEVIYWPSGEFLITAPIDFTQSPNRIHRMVAAKAVVFIKKFPEPLLV